MVVSDLTGRLSHSRNLAELVSLSAVSRIDATRDVVYPMRSDSSSTCVSFEALYAWVLDMTSLMQLYAAVQLHNMGIFCVIVGDRFISQAHSFLRERFRKSFAGKAMSI